MIPSVSMSSSTVRTAWVMCCHLPRGSVNRKSTNWTSFFSIISKTPSTSLIALLHRPLGLSSARLPHSAPTRWRAYMASGPRSPVRIRITSSTGTIKILPSPTRPVAAASQIASIARSTMLSSSTISIFTLGRKSTTYSAPRYSSVWPRCRPKPLASVYGDPLQPDLVQGVLHLVELERLDDGFDLFHRAPLSVAGRHGPRTFRRRMIAHVRFRAACFGGIMRGLEFGTGQGGAGADCGAHGAARNGDRLRRAGPRRRAAGGRSQHHQPRDRAARFPHARPHRRGGPQGAGGRPPRLYAGQRHPRAARGGGGGHRHVPPGGGRSRQRRGGAGRQGHDVLRRADVRRAGGRDPLSQSGLPIYESAIKFSGATAVPIPLYEETGFSFDADEVLSKITPRHPARHAQQPGQPDRRRRPRETFDRLAEGLEAIPTSPS